VVVGDAERFVGRAKEIAALHDIAAKVRAGSPQVVWVLGDPGIGKTALVRRFLAAEKDFTVVLATADRAELSHEYGVVGQLVAHVRGPRAMPVDANPASVGARLLDLLGSLQNGGPIALVLDDLQWIDRPSALALSFVLRRMWADQVLAVLVARPEGYRTAVLPVTDVTVLELTGLAESDVTAMAGAALGTEVDRAAARRLLVHTGGHPLHLRTLLAELPADALRAVDRPLPVPMTLAEAVRGAAAALSRPSRDLLDAMAVLDNDHPFELVARLAGVADPDAALAPAVAAGLAHRAGDRVGIRHGLQREALYAALSPVRRSDLHARAATLLDESSAWAHRVAAVATTDEPLATRLESAAVRAAALGRHGVAARYLRWAADLSPARPDHERRRQLSCVHTLLSRDHRQALELRDRVERDADTPLRSLALGLTDLLAAGDTAGASRWLTDALTRADDGWVRGTAAAGLAGVHAWQGRTDEVIEVARLALSDPTLPTRLIDYTRVLLAVARARRDGMAAAQAELDLPVDPVMVPTAQLDALACRGAIRTMTGDFAAAKRDLRAVVVRQLAGEFTISGTSPLSYLVALHYVEGDWDAATIVADQALSMPDSEDQPQNLALRRMVAALVPAGRGQWAVADTHIRHAASVAERIGGPQDVRYAAIATATLRQARADPAGMLAALRPLADSDDGTHAWWALWWRPLLVEALIGTGAHAEAAEHLRVLDADYLASTVVRLRAALSPDRAIALVSSYLTERVTTVFPLADAMLEHAHGRRLLAADRRATAVTWLNSAKARFTRLGATPFLERVVADLARAGVPAGPATPLSRLTDRELQVAHLARQRLTNRQIAGQLYVTTKTVEYHLGNIYAKLGIRSRTQLYDLITRESRVISSGRTS
jgi:ATP/maltotriose-dependent transcriptional regulator MalT